MYQNDELFKICSRKLAKELPVLRKMNNLSQKDLGDIVGVSRQTITNIENGKSEMKWSLFLALMFIFSMSHNSTEYLKRIDIPYSEIKNWLRKKSRAEK